MRTGSAEERNTCLVMDRGTSPRGAVLDVGSCSTSTTTDRGDSRRIVGKWESANLRYGLKARLFPRGETGFEKGNWTGQLIALADGPQRGSVRRSLTVTALRNLINRCDRFNALRLNDRYHTGLLLGGL